VEQLETMRPDWIKEKKITVLLQYGGKPAADLPGVPMARDLIASPADKNCSMSLPRRSGL